MQVPSEPKVVSIVDSSVRTDTQAAVRDIILDADCIGTFDFCFLAMFIIAIVKAEKVYVAIAIVVISLW